MRTRMFHAIAAAVLILASLMSLAASVSLAGNPPPCEDDEFFLDGVCEGPPRDPTPTPAPPATEPVELEATVGAVPVDGTEAPPGDPNATTEAPADSTPPSLDEVERRMGNLDGNGVHEFELFHYVCPEGVDSHAGNILAGCTGAGTPTFTYSLTYAPTGMFLRGASMATLDGAPGGWYASGDMRMSDTRIPAWENLAISYERVEGYGTAWVSCTLTDYDGQARVQYLQVFNGSAILQGDPGGTISCVWVHAAGLTDDRGVSTPPPGGTDGTPAGTDTTPVGTGTAPTPGVDGETADGVDITLSAYLCPAGVTAADDLVAACNQPSAGQNFYLLTETATVGSQTSDANGGIFFESVPPYPSGVAISADIPSGYGQPIVLCYQASAGGAVREGELPVLFGNQVRLSTAFGDMVECAWYNVPAAGPDNGPNIYIQAMACGPNAVLTPGISVFDATAQCPTAYGGVPFRVTQDDQQVATGATSGDPLSQGQVFFTRLPVGSLVVEAQPSGGAPVLAQFCDQDNADGTYQVTVSVVGTGSTLDAPLVEGQTMRCTWFFFDEAAVIASQATPVSLDSTSTPAALDPTSEAATQQAAQGTVTVTGTLTPEQFEATQAAAAQPIAGDTGDGAAGPPSSLSIAFWTCPAGADSNAAIDQLMATCSIEVTERTVTLTDAAGPRQEIIFGANTWAFQGTTVDIDIASDVTTTFSCEFSWTDTDPNATGTAGATIDGSVLTVQVVQPETGSICDWFLFPDG